MQPQGGTEIHQRSWDKIATSAKVNTLLIRQGVSEFDKARMLAAGAASSGAWLKALPLDQLGLKMSDNEVRIAAGLRLGCPVIHPHTCKRGPAHNMGRQRLRLISVPGTVA